MFPRSSVLLLALAHAAPSLASCLPPILTVPNAEWRALNETVQGRLGALRPWGEPCYQRYEAEGYSRAHAPDLTLCQIAQGHSHDAKFISSQPPAYQDPIYAVCMADGRGCPLSDLPRSNGSLHPLARTCFQGNVPDYYIDVRTVSDIQAGLDFAEQHGIYVVVKNTGHDYKGRSAGRHSLAIWTHNLKPPIQLDEDFKPEGSDESVGPVITYGAGQQFDGIYEFAHKHGYMAMGGACPTVGASGGYITGGGHSLLSPSHGLAVDNVMQMKVVLPNGTYVTANRNQNQDIFFAVRGGGAASFGVVTETTSRVWPEVPLQVAVISFTAALSSKEVTSILVDNGVKWAQEGWGGYLSSLGKSTSLAMAITPNLSLDEAKQSMKPLIDFAMPRNNGSLRFGVDVYSVDNYWDFLHTPAIQYIGGLIDGISVAQASRLVPRENFETDEKRNELVDTLSSMPYGINMVPPVAYDLPESDQQGGPGEASVTPAWRNAIWHIMLQETWDAKDREQHTPSFFADKFRAASQLVDPLRKITPESGAYVNEGDTYEPDHIHSFWGWDNYSRLLKIKAEVDPSNLITCHQCVGWVPGDPRMGCYPEIR